MKQKKIILAVLGLLGAGLIFGYQAQTEAQASLRIGGSRSNFGQTTVNANFMPDPGTATIRSGGTLNISTMNLGAGCRGFATANPDYIFRYNGTSPTGILRFYFRANPGQQGRDTTLVINDAQGRWHCDDDTGGNLNPMVTINRPPAGQYDIWVGSYRSGQYINGSLFWTELSSNHP